MKSQTSKGGIYFYFPNKQAIFLVLLEKMAALLRSRAENAMAQEPDMLKKGDVALHTMLQTFASHRTLTRLFLVEALGAGREFNDRLIEIHASFSQLIKDYLEQAIKSGLIAPLNTDIASVAWFGAVNEVVTRWVLTGQPEQLEDAYPGPARAFAPGYRAGRTMTDKQVRRIEVMAISTDYLNGLANPDRLAGKRGRGSPRRAAVCW